MDKNVGIHHEQNLGLRDRQPMNEFIPGVVLPAPGKVRNFASEHMREAVLPLLLAKEALRDFGGAIRAAIGDANDLATRPLSV
jgi:hypothetical protein